MAMRMAVCSFLLIAAAVNAQTINLHGKVTANGGDPIKDAIVTLVGQNLKDTTGSDGTYEIKQTTDVKAVQELQPQNRIVSLNKGILEFSLPDATPLRIETFDVKGNLLKRESV
ncbi:MAG: hypothetical protein JXB48_20100, partial [Candidatus Latescibacteria bacterium]|nr:hypothetical protein [Candidatus Latescibacterota bacterium]